MSIITEISAAEKTCLLGNDADILSVLRKERWGKTSAGRGALIKRRATDNKRKDAKERKKACRKQ